MSTRGYTLIEMLVAMTMFALVTVATSYALTAGIRAHQNSQRKARELEERAAISRVLTRDLIEATATTGNQYSQFLATGSQNGTLLTLTTLAHRMQLPDETSMDTGTDDPNLSNMKPQSDVVAVTYMYDSTTHTLSRIEMIPYSLDDPSQQDQSQNILSRHVASISFQFLDSSGQQRTDWYYTNQSSSTSSSTSSSSSSNSSSSSQDGDTELPTAVQITIEMDTEEGAPLRFTNTVALATPQPLPAGQTPSSSTTSSSTSTSTGSRAPALSAVRRRTPHIGPRPLLPGGILPGIPGLPGAVR